MVPLAVAGTENTGDTVAGEDTVLGKGVPDSTSGCTAASRKDPEQDHPEKVKK